MPITASKTRAVEATLQRWKDAPLRGAKLDNLLRDVVRDLVRAATVAEAKEILEASAELVHARHYGLAKGDATKIESFAKGLTTLKGGLTQIDDSLFDHLAQQALNSNARITPSEVKALGELARFVAAKAPEPPKAIERMAKTVDELIKIAEYSHATPQAARELELLRTRLAELAAQAGPVKQSVDGDLLETMKQLRVAEAVPWVDAFLAAIDTKVGVKGVLTHDKLDFIEAAIARSYAPVLYQDGRSPRLLLLDALQWNEEQLSTLEERLPELRKLATQLSGGNQKLHAVAVPPHIIPIPAVREAVIAAGKAIRGAATKGAPTKNDAPLTYGELHEAITLIKSPKADQKSREAFVRAYAKAMGIPLDKPIDKAIDGATSGEELARQSLLQSLQAVRRYMQTGDNQILQAGLVQIHVGERPGGYSRQDVPRRVPVFQLPSADGTMSSSVDNDAAARKLIEQYEGHLKHSQLDLIFFTWEKKLYVGVNPHGDVDEMRKRTGVPIYDHMGEKLLGTGRVLHVVDQINSHPETHVGWLRRLRQRVFGMLQEVTDPGNRASKAAEALEGLAKSAPPAAPAAAPGQPGGTPATVGQWAIGVAAVTGVGAGVTYNAPAMGAAIAALLAVPIGINLAQYLTEEQSMKPIEDLMGVTLN